MFEIIEKKALNQTVTKMVVYAPHIAKKAQAGQFVILRACEDGERIPLTIADYDRQAGTITIIFQIVGKTTMLLNELAVHDTLPTFVGPLGNASEINNLKKVAVIGGGVGSAIAYPLAKALHEQGTMVHVITGFRNQELVILKDEFEAISDRYELVSDDGSTGKQGFVTTALEELIESGEMYDQVIAIGPLLMMKAVSELTKRYEIPTTVSMNPIMIDGTGMCGGCRLSVGGEIKFACVDGPDFDGHLVDFDEVINRSKTYREFENRKREEHCNLMKERS